MNAREIQEEVETIAAMEIGNQDLASIPVQQEIKRRISQLPTDHFLFVEDHGMAAFDCGPPEYLVNYMVVHKVVRFLYHVPESECPYCMS